MGKNSPSPGPFQGTGSGRPLTRDMLRDPAGFVRQGADDTRNLISGIANTYSGAPDAPDYSMAAQQQANSSQGAINQQTNANRPGQTTLFGNTLWTQGPDGQWHQTTSLNGGLGQAGQGLLQQAGKLATPMDWSQFGKLDDGSAAREQAINASYTAAQRRLDPRFRQEGEAMQAQLANQGLDPTSEAYRAAQNQLSNERNDAYGGAMDQAIREGTAAQQATFGENLSARQQAIAEALKARGQPVDELNALQGFQQMPGFNAAGAADPIQSLAAAMASGNFDLNRWGQAMGFTADEIQGLGQALGSFSKAAGGSSSGQAGLMQILSLLGGV